jgi:hypothetical protein
VTVSTHCDAHTHSLQVIALSFSYCWWFLSFTFDIRKHLSLIHTRERTFLRSRDVSCLVFATVPLIFPLFTHFTISFTGFKRRVWFTHFQTRVNLLSPPPSLSGTSPFLSFVLRERGGEALSQRWRGGGGSFCVFQRVDSPLSFVSL